MRASWLVAMLSLVVATAACSQGGASPSVGGGTPSPSSVPTERPTPTERAATIVASIALEGHPTALQMAFGNGDAWIRFADGSVARVNLETKAIVATIPVGSGEFGSLVVGQDAVWVTTFDENKVSRIDPATNTVVAEIAVGANPEGITVTPGAVWVSNHRGGSIWRIDPATNAVVAKIEVGAVGPSGPKFLQYAFGDVWTSVPNSSVVVRVDPGTNAVAATIDVVIVEDLVIGDDFAYATDAFTKISQIDPASNEVLRRFYPDVMPWLFGDGAFWAPDGSDVLRLDESSFAPTEVWHVAGAQGEYAAMAFHGGTLWLLTDDGFLVGVQFTA
jgi:YVTN family beta-propeller protein